MKMHKAITRLMEKNPDSCSICKTQFDDSYVVYTVFGYDKINRLQVSSGCCQHKIVKIVMLGICGYFPEEKRDEYMRRHPLFEEMKDHL
jgi:hypothetical protein